MIPIIELGPPRGAWGSHIRTVTSPDFTCIGHIDRCVSDRPTQIQAPRPPTSLLVASAFVTGGRPKAHLRLLTRIRFAAISAYFNFGLSEVDSDSQLKGCWLVSSQECRSVAGNGIGEVMGTACGGDAGFGQCLN